MDEVGVVNVPGPIGWDPPPKAPPLLAPSISQLGVVNQPNQPALGPSLFDNISGPLFVFLLVVASIAIVSSPFTLLNWLVIRYTRRLIYFALLAAELAWTIWYWAQAFYAATFNAESLIGPCGGNDAYYNQCDGPLEFTRFQVYSRSACGDCRVWPRRLDHSSKSRSRWSNWRAAPPVGTR